MKTYLLTFRNALYVSSMSHNLIPPFIMRAAGLIVNDVPRIHTKTEDLTNETHCIVSEGEDSEVKMKIPLKLDGIFSYFETRELTMEEINHCEYMETVDLCPNRDAWDPYDPAYADMESSMVDCSRDVIVPTPKKRKVLESRYVFEINVSEERYEAAVSSIVAQNCTQPLVGGPAVEANPQCSDNEFNRDDDVYKAAISELSVCFDEDLMCRAVNDRCAKSKLAMEAGSTNVQDITEDDGIFELSAAHAETPKGITAQHLSNVWRISHEEAVRTLDVTTQLNRQSMDASLS